MDDKEIRIKIDPNGNVHREVVERPEPEVKKPRFLRKIVPSLPV
jgi:hypothetical protein